MFGTDAQKARWLTPLASGEKLGAWALTEPNAGSDAAGTRTTAVRDGDALGAQRHQDLHHARRQRRRAGRDGLHRPRRRAPRASPPSSSSAARQDCAPGRKEDKLGMRASETTEVILDQCRVPADQLLGEVGMGFIGALQVLDAGRIGIAALSVGLAQGAFDCSRTLRVLAQAVRPAHRLVPGHPVEAGRHGHAHRGGAPAHVSSRVSQGSPAAARRSSRRWRSCMPARSPCARPRTPCRFTAGYGFVKDYPAEKFFRDVKLTTIGEGTSEIQRLVIARQLLA